MMQARKVRRTAQLLPEPDGPRIGHAGSGPALRLLITGDSSAAGVGASTQTKALSGQLQKILAPYFTLSWHVEAKTGHCTRDTLAQLQNIPQQQFDCAVIALGVNDVTGGTSKAQFTHQQSQLLELLQKRFSVQQILMSGVPPVQNSALLSPPLSWFIGCQATRLNQALIELASQFTGATHLSIDFPTDPEMTASDGYHPSEAAYALWARAVAQHILPKQP